MITREQQAITSRLESQVGWSNKYHELIANLKQFEYDSNTLRIIRDNLKMNGVAV